MKFLYELQGLLLPNRSGNSVGMALFLAAIVMVTAVVAPPYLNRAAEAYADNRAFGVDRITTATVDKPKRRVIRRSVLD